MQKTFRERLAVTSLVAAIGSVLAASAFTPRGVCGTAHSFLLSVLVGIVWDPFEGLLPVFVARVMLAIVNTAIFSALCLLLHRWRVNLTWKYPLLLAFAAAAYIYSYLFLLPTQDCP